MTVSPTARFDLEHRTMSDREVQAFLQLCATNRRRRRDCHFYRQPLFSPIETPNKGTWVLLCAT